MHVKDNRVEASAPIHSSPVAQCLMAVAQTAQSVYQQLLFPHCHALVFLGNPHKCALDVDAEFYAAHGPIRSQQGCHANNAHMAHIIQSATGGLGQRLCTPSAQSPASGFRPSGDSDIEGLRANVAELVVRSYNVDVVVSSRPLGPREQRSEPGEDTTMRLLQ
jgi:hypothetical protein